MTSLHIWSGTWHLKTSPLWWYACTLHTVHCTHCTVYTVICTQYLYILHCTLYIAHRTLYSVLNIVQFAEHCTVCWTLYSVLNIALNTAHFISYSSNSTLYIVQLYHPTSGTIVNALTTIHWCWCTDAGALMMMHWLWCTDYDAMTLMHWCWCTDDDALMLMHWWPWRQTFLLVGFSTFLIVWSCVFSSSKHN